MCLLPCGYIYSLRCVSLLLFLCVYGVCITSLYQLARKIVMKIAEAETFHIAEEVSYISFIYL